MSDIDSRIDALESRSAIRTAVFRFFEYVDYRLSKHTPPERHEADFALLNSVTPQLVFSSELHGRLETAEAFESYLDTSAASATLSFHLVTNEVIEFAGAESLSDMATVEFFTLGFLTFNSPALFVGAVWTGSAIRVDGVWRLDRLNPTYRFVSDHEMGWAKQQFIGGPLQRKVV